MKISSFKTIPFIILAFATSCSSVIAQSPPDTLSYSRWIHGPSPDTGFFPLAVWLQDPALATQYKKAGFNTYVGLWKGPTEEQLTVLRSAGMKVICEQNEVALQHIDDATIIGWMHGDEPDNAQELPAAKGYGPPIPTEQIIREYQRIKSADPSRPVMLNLGQGVAWDNWVGRGARNHHPEDYAQYIKGADIVSFDIYPVVHPSPEVSGQLWYVARGVERLLDWSKGEKIIWNCLECTHISDPDRKATPQQVSAEAWMAIIHGSRGLIYFVHEFKPKFNAAALLDDPEMLEAVTALNQEITSLAPVLNTPDITGAVRMQTTNREMRVAVMTKQHIGSIYLFAAEMRNGTTAATFTVRNLRGKATVTVLGENRTINARNGVFKDIFHPWEVHIYRVNMTR